jgi:hypothetical protein
MPVDKHGNQVKVGSFVRVIEIDSYLLEILPDEEVDHVKSMLGEIFEVYEIDDYGCAQVEKWWDYGGGRFGSHSLSLSSAEMEVVSGDGKSS